MNSRRAQWLRKRPRAQLGLMALVAVAAGAIIPLPAQYSAQPAPEDQQALRAALEHIHTIEMRPRILGYSRQRFGRGWGSRATADGRYCNTRQLLVQTTFATGATAGSRPPTTGCKTPVEAVGVKPKDPYTGNELSADHVDVDHIVPLSAAWDLGAHRWDEAKRVSFANDMEWNLVVVDSTVNRDKSDSTLSEWMPPSPAAQCPYSARFVMVVARYGLALPKNDVKVARKACELP